ncbi:metal-dependent phosphohydrolase, HD subdomain protein [Paractinoplanes deccanensis]|uniref:Metal-dependent phosphohydrolase, HD subdomain protein n=1 Tax=Paractinoplanes deccanensis TaxID=113561 RepID=A0ABQ3Y7V4_9ACTN|nr:HD domain-containing protein [Actinoplanes deccanensis]GID76030.1 metal-dependent phosphohydrolase, HD subdomain protein [Actinoplanes deccanensis]
MDQIEAARDLARELLAGAIPRRWVHSQGVGRKAESVAHVVGHDAAALVSAAWLHDIGYAPGLVVTGMHQLDGARYLRDVAGADQLVCRLVAHHSCAFVEARNRGLAEQLAREFPPVGGLLADAITYADMTTDPDGEPVEVEQRLAEILARYGDGHLVAESIREASPFIIGSVRSLTAALTAG